MQGLGSTFRAWTRFLPSMTGWTAILKTPLSLAGRIITPAWGALGLVGLGAKSMAGSLLGGGWLRFFLNPYTLLVVGLVASHGWVYHKGKQHERITQARAIIALNQEVLDWRQQYEAADSRSETKLQAALDNWRKTSGTNAVITSTCKLPPNAVTAIADIAGD